MDNLEANSKSIQPETENTGGNKTNPKPSTADTHGGINHPNHPQGPHLPAPLIEVEEHKPSNSASVSNPPEEDGTNNASPIPEHRTDPLKTNNLGTAKGFSGEHGSHDSEPVQAHPKAQFSESDDLSNAE